MSLFAATFCCGMFAGMVQVLFIREALVVFHGSELSIGAAMAAWLVGVSAGAAAARVLSGRAGSNLLAKLPAGLLAAGGLLAPLQLCGIRTARWLAGVPPGEYGSLAALLACSLALFVPTAGIVGMFFPTACVIAAGKCGGDNRRQASALSWVYAGESLGSMAGGAALAWLILPFLDNARAVCLASCVAFAGSALSIFRPGRGRLFFRWALAAAAAGLLFASWQPFVRRQFAALRWRSMGILPRGAEGGGGGGAELVDDIDTPYQNLALIRISGQCALYANGVLAGIFPDPVGTEHNVHFIMAQKPRSRRVLLVGGIPTEDIPELLRYPVGEIVYVELDPGVGRILERGSGAEYCAAVRGPRILTAHDDAVRFVRRCGGRFDAVIVNAPEPVTLAANRWLTREFFLGIRGVLASDGFMAVSVPSSERLQAEAAAVGGSVYRTLKSVFPVVLATAESRNRFFAGFQESALTFDRQELFRRSSSANLSTRYFRPEYFLFADEIDPSKTELARRRFEGSLSDVNTVLHPSTCGYGLVLWSRFSGSGVERFTKWARQWNARALSWVVTGIGILILAGGWFLRGARGSGCGRFRGGWRFAMLAASIGACGFCGMGLDMALILLFQSLLGCIYTKLGIVNSVFMAGLAAGAVSGRGIAARGEKAAWVGLAAVQMGMAAMAFAIPAGASLALARIPDMDVAGLCVYAAVGISGWCVGALFMLANFLLIHGGSLLGNAAAITELADHLGAALSALALGAFFFPALGVSGSCVLIGSVGLCALAAIVSARLVSRLPCQDQFQSPG